MAAQYVLASSDSATNMARDQSRSGRGRPVRHCRPRAGRRSDGRRCARAGGSITSLAPSSVPVAGRGVIWVGTSTRLHPCHARRRQDVGERHAAEQSPGQHQRHRCVARMTPGTAYAAILSNDRRPHLYRTLNFGGAWQEITAGLADDGTARVVREDPVDPNLLYAGTRDERVRLVRPWRSLAVASAQSAEHRRQRHDRPRQRSRDLDVRPRLLDSRRRVAAPADSRRTAANTRRRSSFKPDTVVRARWDNTQDTPLPPEMVVGENPPEGAILDYYLAAPASRAPVTLSIATAPGISLENSRASRRRRTP